VHGNPESAAAHNNLGYQLMKRGLMVEAERQFREAIATSTGSRTARNNLGLLLTERGDLASAWEQFAAGSVDKAAARNNFAVALLNSGKLYESREHLTLALRERRGYAPALRNFQIVQARIKSASYLQTSSPTRSQGSPLNRETGTAPMAIVSGVPYKVFSRAVAAGPESGEAK
jgi:Tfp pilus assembly protein PilF